MLNSMSNASIGGENTASALNNVYAQGMNLSKELFSIGNIDNISMYIYGFLFGAATIISCLIVLAILIYAKMAIGDWDRIR